MFMENFQENILKIGVFCNKVIFEAIFKVFFEDIETKRTIIPINFVLTFPFSS